MESLAKIVSLIIGSITLGILAITIFFLNKWVPKIYWAWWFLLGPASLVFSFLVSIGIIKTILYFKDKTN